MTALARVVNDALNLAIPAGMVLIFLCGAAHNESRRRAHADSRSWWTHLSDTELAGHLRRAGTWTMEAAALTAARHEPWAADTITKILERRSR